MLLASRVMRGKLIAYMPLLIVALLGAQALTFDFVWDDLPMIKGDVVHDLAYVPDVFANRTMFVSPHDATISRHGLQTYRPLTILSFMVDAALFGHEAWGFHLTSLVLHLLMVGLLMVWSRLLIPDAPRWLPVLAATWFAVNPFLVEAYVWINGRSDVLSTLFGVAVVCLFCVRERSSWHWSLRAALIAMCTLACLLSKETGVAWLITLPLLPSSGEDHIGKRLRSCWLPVALSCVVYLVLRVRALDGAHVAHPSQLLRALLIAPFVILDSLGEMVVPRYTTVRWLSFELRDTAVALFVIAGVGLLALIGVAWRLRTNVPSLTYGVLVSVLSLAPVALIATGGWPGFGRYLYAPAAALAPGLAAGTHVLWSRWAPVLTERSRWLLRAGGIVYLIGLAVLCVLSARPFASERGLYESWIAGTPDHPHGYRWLGLTLFEEHDFAAAVPVFAAARERDPMAKDLIDYELRSLQALGKHAEAAALADRVAESYRLPQLHVLALLALRTADPTRALMHARRCIELDPANAQCRFWVDRLTASTP